MALNLSWNAIFIKFNRYVIYIIPILNSIQCNVIEGLLKERRKCKNKTHKEASLVKYTVLTSITSLVYKVEKSNFLHCRNCQAMIIAFNLNKSFLPPLTPTSSLGPGFICLSSEMKREYCCLSTTPVPHSPESFVASKLMNLYTFQTPLQAALFLLNKHPHD